MQKGSIGCAVNGFAHGCNPGCRLDIKLSVVLFLSRQQTILSDIYESNCYQAIKKTFVWYGANKRNYNPILFSGAI